MNKIPCKQCGQTKGETFHSMEEAVQSYRNDADEAWRRGDDDKHNYLRNYMERMKADCISAGYDFHPFTPLTNLEYLEYKVAQKEGRGHEILYKRYAFWPYQHNQVLCPSVCGCRRNERAYHYRME